MSLQEYFSLVFSDYTLRTITLGTAILGAITGMLGCFAVLRKQSLLGDAISHAALPGIAIAFLITGAKDTNTLLLGALVSGLIGTFWIRGIIHKTHLKSDTALGLILSLFFGFGICKENSPELFVIVSKPFWFKTSILTALAGPASLP